MLLIRPERVGTQTTELEGFLIFLQNHFSKPEVTKCVREDQTAVNI